MKNLKVSLLYLRKILCFKNIILFSIMFILIWSFYSITTLFSVDIYDKLTNFIIFYTFFISIIISFLYIYLKNINIKNYENNSLINFFLIFGILIFFYTILFVFVDFELQDSWLLLPAYKVDLKDLRFLFFICLNICIFELLIISFSNYFIKNFRNLIFVIVLFIVNVILLLLYFKLVALGLSGEEKLVIFKEILGIFILLNIFAISCNFVIRKKIAFETIKNRMPFLYYFNNIYK